MPNSANALAEAEKRGDLEAKASTFLRYALRADTPLGVALASGARLVLILRQSGITPEQLTFSIAREVHRGF
jgi:hypothetical protein